MPDEVGIEICVTAVVVVPRKYHTPVVQKGHGEHLADGDDVIPHLTRSRVYCEGYGIYRRIAIGELGI